MKPIHNELHSAPNLQVVVIPHKVNDLNETNSQRFRGQGFRIASCDSSQS